MIRDEVRKLKKYFSIFKYSLKRNATFIVDYIFAALSFTVHMLVFNCLWEYILKDGSIFGYTKSELIWYIVVTEFITYSVTAMHKRISASVKDGTIANMLIKPINSVGYFLCEQSSDLIRILINLIAGIIIGITMAGPINVSFGAVALCILSCVISIIIANLIQVAVGLIAFYIEETRSIYFIVQKFQLLLVFVPINFYNKFVQGLLLLSPTTYMVFVPAKILVKYAGAADLKWIGLQLIAAFAMTILVINLYRKGVKKINVNGG